LTVVSLTGSVIRSDQLMRPSDPALNFTTDALKLRPIRYDTIGAFNVDSKAEYSA